MGHGRLFGKPRYFDRYGPILAAHDQSEAYFWAITFEPFELQSSATHQNVAVFILFHKMYSFHNIHDFPIFWRKMAAILDLGQFLFFWQTQDQNNGDFL